MEHEVIHPSITVLGSDDLFGLVTLAYDSRFEAFALAAATCLAEVEGTTSLREFPYSRAGQATRDDLLSISILPLAGLHQLRDYPAAGRVHPVGGAGKGAGVRRPLRTPLIREFSPCPRRRAARGTFRQIRRRGDPRARRRFRVELGVGGRCRAGVPGQGGAELRGVHGDAPARPAPPLARQSPGSAQPFQPQQEGPVELLGALRIAGADAGRQLSQGSGKPEAQGVVSSLQNRQ